MPSSLKGFFSYTLMAYENLAFNATVGFVTSVTPYANYSIVNENQYFGIDPVTGRIFVSNPPDSDIVPRLKKTELVVQASFNGYPPKMASVLVNIQIIDKNDNQPVFPDSEKLIYFTNTIPMGALITIVKAEDLDGFPFNEVFYSLSEQNLFDIDSKSGKIIAITDVEFSLSNQYLFEVMASNLNTTSVSRMTIIIQLRTLFQNTATFVHQNNEFEISRRSSISSIIGQLEALSVFGTAKYFISPNEFMVINRNTGDLMLNKKFESSENLTITSIVKSGILNEKPPSICTITVVTNELAPSPVFPEKHYIMKMAADAEPLTEVLRFNFILPADVQMSIEGVGSEVSTTKKYLKQTQKMFIEKNT